MSGTGGEFFRLAAEIFYNPKRFPISRKKEIKTFTCRNCEGLGFYQMFNRYELGFSRHCYACNGKGFITRVIWVLSAN